MHTGDVECCISSASIKAPAQSSLGIKVQFRLSCLYFWTGLGNQDL